MLINPIIVVVALRVALPPLATPPPPPPGATTEPTDQIHRSNSKSKSKDSPADWRFVHGADLIIRAEVTLGKEAEEGKPSGYQTRTVRIIEVLKGGGLLQPPAPSPTAVPNTLSRSLDLRGVSTDKQWQGLCHEQGKDVMLFLGTEVEEVPKRGWYLLDGDSSAVQPYSPGLANALLAEIRNQDALATSVRSQLQARTFPHEEEIRQLVDRLLDPKTYARVEGRKLSPEQKSWSYPEPMVEFETLGPDAIPAIIKMLDDRRPLPGGRVNLGMDNRKNAGAWEGIYHTSASQVLDFLCRALQQLTHEGIGDVTAESPNCRRDAAVAGWLVYLGHSEKWSKVLEVKGMK